MFTKEVRDEIITTARRFSADAAAILAIAEVESAGIPFWTVNGKQVPAIRFEGHYFHRILNGSKRERAIREGLAHPRAGRIPNPRSWAARYALLERAKRIDKDAAIRSCSWGLGQVMGEHYKSFGFKTPQDLVDVAMSGVAGQVELMIRFIDRNGLRPLIEQRNWAAFARAYNGPAYKKNRYDTKMAKAYRRYAGAEIIEDGSLSDIQSDLAELGYTVGPIDGLMGPKTKQAIIKFQRDEGLVEDGLPGMMTVEALNEAITEFRDKKANDRKAPTYTGVGAAIMLVVVGIYEKFESIVSWVGSLFQ